MFEHELFAIDCSRDARLRNLTNAGQKLTKTFGQLFGELVLRYRTQKGWVQAELATQAWGKGDRDFVGQKREAQIRRIEDGKAAKPWPRTIKAMQDALGIPQAEIDALLGAIATPHPDLVAVLIERNAVLAKNLKLNHKVVVEIARAYARSAADDFDGALASIQTALINTRELDGTRQLYANLDESVSGALDNVIETAKAGQLHDARLATDAYILAMVRGQKAAHVIALNLAQQANDPKSAADHILAKLKLDTPPDLFEAAMHERLRQLEIGRDTGDAFALVLSIHLAEAMLHFSTNAQQTGIALNGIAVGCKLMGVRAADRTYLSRAVHCCHQAIEITSREIDREPWAKSQNNLGNALRGMGDLEQSEETLLKAVDAFEASLSVRSARTNTNTWAKTLNNLGNAYRSLFSLTQNVEYAENAIAVYEKTLTVRNRVAFPKEWARTQNNIGQTELALGIKLSCDEHLKRAEKAFALALLERNSTDTGFEWAMTQNNLADLDLAFHALSPDPDRLISAREKAMLARKVFLAAKAGAFVEPLDQLLAQIDAARNR